MLLAVSVADTTTIDTISTMPGYLTSPHQADQADSTALTVEEMAQAAETENKKSQRSSAPNHHTFGTLASRLRRSL